MKSEEKGHRAYVETLKGAILRLHECQAEHFETVPVKETFQGKTVWDGEVEVFNLRGHPKAVRAYAWGHRAGPNDETMRYVAVLELPPVTSPETAVRAATMQEIKSAREEIKSRASKTGKG
jgi:hypothetical protein